MGNDSSLEKAGRGDMYKKILAPLDGSKFSECSLDHVTAVAKGCQVPDVVLLHVLESYERYAGYTGISQEALGEIRKEFQAQTEDHMAKVADKLKKKGVNAKTAIVEGKPADEILNYAEKNHVDLIIMSTHGNSGFTRWAFGSVADKVIRHSPVPVLVISPPGCRK
jgi:nucleotide-binding universal stress UspA family protein